MKLGSGKYFVGVSGICLMAIIAVSSAFASKLQTFTGTVGDAVCGAKHTMDGDDIYCLRTCIRRGSKYDLIVGDKVYVLNLKDQSSADTLDRLGTQQARALVKGEANGDIIDVESVAAAK
jgi:hypothetical protein